MRRPYLQLTERRAEALRLLKEGELAPEEFARRMSAVGLGRTLVRDLVGRGLVERREPEGKGPVLGVTEEGLRLLAEPPWECPYCLGKTWQRGVVVSWRACGSCGAEHRCCKKCTRRLVVVTGQFPSYRPALRHCPSGAAGPVVRP